MLDSNLLMHELYYLLYHTNKFNDKMPFMAGKKKREPVFSWLPLSFNYIYSIS
jgi:hypothetical protein